MRVRGLATLGCRFGRELCDGGCLMGLGAHGAKRHGGIAFVRDLEELSVAIQYSARCKMQDAKCRGHGVSTSEARARSGSSLVRQVPNGFHLACGDVVKIRLLIGPYHRHLDLFCSHSSPFVEASPKACVMPPWIVRTNDDESSRVAAAKLLGPSQSQVACTGWHHLQRINGGQYFVSFLCQRAGRGLIVEYRAGHARGSEPGIPEGRDLPKSSTEGIGSPPAPFLEGWTVEGVGGETARYCSASTPAASTRPVLRCF